MEKRELTRVLFNIEASIKSQNHSFKGKVENLSLKGMFIKTEEKLAPHDPLEITIYLAGETSELEIKLTGEVVRTTLDGVGIFFHKVDLDSFIHLRNIVAYNSGDEDQVMDEFFKYVNHSSGTDN